MTDGRATTGAWPIVPPGIWLELRTPRVTPPRRALFLDRDGVIVQDRGYLASPADAVLLPGAAALIRKANEVGIRVVVATNQSGIDRGLFGWDSFAAVEARIAALLKVKGAFLDATAACPFHPDFTAGYGEAHARCRKPGPGMLIALSDALGIDLAESWMIGDQTRDIEAARAAGLAGAVLLAGTADSGASASATATFAVRTVESPAAASDLLAETLLRSS